MKKIGKLSTGWQISWGYAGEHKDTFRRQKDFEQKIADLEARGEDYHVETFEYAVYKRYPFEGKATPKVEDRPRCPECGKRLRPRVHEDRVLGVRRWEGYEGYGHFCSLKCTNKFANYVIDADLEQLNFQLKIIRRYNKLNLQA